MTTISFPTNWKKQWGFSGASILAYMVEQEEEHGEWFSVLSKDIQSALSLHPTGINTARERLRADQVIDVKRVGVAYQYRINHDRLAELSADEQTTGA